MQQGQASVQGYAARRMGGHLIPAINRVAPLLALSALALLGTLLLTVLLAAAPAFAAESHFGHSGEGAGEFVEPHGVAVSQESGDVYVADRNNNRIERFAGDGAFVSGWGFGVADGSTEASQLCTTTCFAGVPGAGAGQLDFPTGVAVDNSPFGLSRGEVYVIDSNNHRVEKFTASGEFVLTFGKDVNKTTGGNVCLAGEECKSGTEGHEGVELEAPGAIAVDGEGKLFVGDRAGSEGENGRVLVFGEGGMFEREVELPGAGGVEALAPAPGGDVYVKSAGLAGVREYEACATTCTGVEVAPVRDESGSPRAIAVDGAGNLFVGDSNGGFHVLEFDPAGAEVASFASRTPIGSTGGLALAEAGGEANRVYESFGYEIGFNETEYGVWLFPVPPPGPLVVEGSETSGELEPTSATLEAYLNAEGHVGTSYKFEYGETESYTASTSEETLAGEGFEDEHVSAALSGLKVNSTYHFRLVASSECEPANPGHLCVTDGPDQTFTTLPAVSIESESASQISATSALLETDLNPHGVASKFHFEYLTEAEFTADGGTFAGPDAPVSVPQPVGEAGSGKAAVALSVLAEHLAPGTPYHYRVVASNVCEPVTHPGVQCVLDGPDRTFTTQVASGSSSPLIDGRAWELVSPPDKHAASLESISLEGGLIQAAGDGSAIAYFAKGPITGEPVGNRSIADAQVLSSRTATGWTTREIATPHEAVAGVHAGEGLAEYQIFSTDLGSAVVEPGGVTPLPPLPAGSERTPYLRHNEECAPTPGEAIPPGCYTALVTAGSVPPETKFGGTETQPGSTIFVAGSGVEAITATPDAQKIILTSPQDLSTPTFKSNELASIYEWSDGALKLASVMPNDKPAAEEGLSSFAGESDLSVRGAVSSDGNRVVFATTPATGGKDIYLRDMAREETVQLDAPAPGVKPSGGHARFQLANAAGTRVLFTDDQRLTTDSTAQNGRPDLYMCEVTVLSGRLSCELKDLTVDHNGGEAGDVLGSVLGAGEEAGRVYFVADGALLPGAKHGDCKNEVAGEPAEDVSCNLYVYDTATEATTLIARLAGRDAPDWAGAGSEGGLNGLTARSSPNGRFLAFSSQRSLTGYDNRDAVSGAADEEVYLYDAGSGGAGRLVCASCDPSGGRPVGQLDTGEFPGLLVDRPEIWKKQTLAGSIPGWTSVDSTRALYQSHYLSDEGRLFFDSPAGLVPEAGNGKQDVYEYEPEGAGGGGTESSRCGPSSANGDEAFKPARPYEAEAGQGEEPPGCVGLISAGSSSEESAFLDASENGEDVFFMTAAKLAPQDLDTALDIYDAHVCTATSPCPAAASTAPPPCTTAGSCRAAPTPQPGIFGAPASATLGGPGNPAPPAATPTVKPKPLTRAQKLAKALKACRKDRAKGKRVACEKQAHRRFGPAKKAKKSSHDRRSGR